MHSPVFIVGMNGSGTTLMLELLNRHPSVYGYPHETIVLPALLQDARRAKLHESALEERKQWVRKHFLASPALAKELTDSVWTALEKDSNIDVSSPQGAFAGLMSVLAARDGKVIWCEKTPMHVKHIKLLAEYFPGARFIHMVRDPRACAASFNRRWGFHPLRSVLRWKECIYSARSAASIVGEKAYMEVRYEDLLAKPQNLLGKVQTFLALQVQDLNKMRSEGRQLNWFADGEIKPQDTDYEAYFDHKLLERMYKIAGTEMASLGYLDETPMECVNPSRYQRLTWLTYDMVNRGLASVRTELFNPNDRRGWKVRLQTVLAAVKARLVDN